MSAEMELFPERMIDVDLAYSLLPVLLTVLVPLGLDYGVFVILVVAAVV
jgi:hypothetical protein